MAIRTRLCQEFHQLGFVYFVKLRRLFCFDAMPSTWALDEVCTEWIVAICMASDLCCCLTLCAWVFWLLEQSGHSLLLYILVVWMLGTCFLDCFSSLAAICCCMHFIHLLLFLMLLTWFSIVSAACPQFVAKCNICLTLLLPPLLYACIYWVV